VKDDDVYLQHIRDAITRLTTYTRDGRETFLANPQIQDAVARNLEIIGEAVKHLSEELRQRYPDIPWKRIAGMRDELIHEYFGIDPQIVWNVVERHLPVLNQRIKAMLDRGEGPG